MKRQLLFTAGLLLLAIATMYVGADAATVYLRDRTRVKAVIVSESTESFEIRQEGVNYSPFYKSDALQKVDIYAIIDDSGELKYPHDLSAPLSAFDPNPGSESEYYNRMLSMQMSANHELSRHVKSISTVLWLEFIAAALAVGYFAAIAGD
jgi:hypothetical protein